MDEHEISAFLKHASQLKYITRQLLIFILNFYFVARLLKKKRIKKLRISYIVLKNNLPLTKNLIITKRWCAGISLTLSSQHLVGMSTTHKVMQKLTVKYT